MAKIITRAAALVGTLPRSIKKSGKPIRSAAPKHTICRFVTDTQAGTISLAHRDVIL